jgi:hypothetical protein
MMCYNVEEHTARAAVPRITSLMSVFKGDWELRALK